MSEPKVWTRRYTWESIIDVGEDIAYCEAVPDGTFTGIVKVTVEYFPDA